MSDKFRVAILVSGGGSNMEALIQAAEKGALPRAQIVLVISNKPDAGAIRKARFYGVEVVVVDSRSYGNDDDGFQAEVFKQLIDYRIDIVCLAGYLKRVGKKIVDRYADSILNIHPALLPNYGGPGMYGSRVHEAVLKAGEKESGCSVHLVDDEFDHGRVLAQVRVPIQPGDSPEKLAERILEQEHQLYPVVLAQFCEQRVVSGRKS